ncbi:MAG TPA: DNA-processing protein DprA [Ktedonobacteraceae bacterium]|nr:DNA-processing protein DprA [Ktedonobacteraceae bacterium]
MEVIDTPAGDSETDALSPEALACWVALSRVTGIGPASFKALLDYFDDDVEAAWKAGRVELVKAGIARRAIENLLKLRATITPLEELEKLKKQRMGVLTWKDKLYPPLLREIDDAPPVLYLYGKLTEADRFALAVVGTRNSSTYGQQVTERMVTELAKGSVTIVSGLALGIDTIAHSAALDAGGRTIAVLACGLDIIYPPVNRGLAHRIVESGQGVLISEYAPGMQPESGNFPSRNRIISGLSLGVLVVEAPEKSGALITADSALRQGRDVFAIPGSILSSRSAGANKLIQDGARPVMDVKDIIESLNLFMIPHQIEMQAILPDNAEEGKLLALLSHDPQHIDDLIRSSDLPTTTVASTLTMMESKTQFWCNSPLQGNTAYSAIAA